MAGSSEKYDTDSQNAQKSTGKSKKGENQKKCFFNLSTLKKRKNEEK